MFAAARAHAQPTDVGELAYEEGRRLYDLGEWDGAIAKFKASYTLRSDAASLFNIAQAYRLKLDCVEAETFYKTYKASFPSAMNIAKVDRFIAELEPCARAAGAVLEPIKPTPPVKLGEPVQPAPPTVHVVSRSDGEPGYGKRIVGITVVGLGTVAFSVGVYFGLQARSKARDVTSGSGLWDPSIETNGKSANTRAEILFSLGGAALVSGGILYWLGRRAASDRKVAIVPHGNGAMVVWARAL